MWTILYECSALHNHATVGVPPKCSTNLLPISEYSAHSFAIDHHSWRLLWMLYFILIRAAGVCMDGSRWTDARIQAQVATRLYRHHISCKFAYIRRNHAITTHVNDIYRHFNHASHQQHVFIFVIFISAITYNSTSDKSKEKEIRKWHCCWATVVFGPISRIFAWFVMVKVVMFSDL